MMLTKHRTMLTATLLVGWIIPLAGFTSAEVQRENSDDKLTYADFGIYGRAGSPYYTSPDCPFRLFVLQWSVGEVPEALNRQLKQMHEMGRKAILETWFWKGYAEKGGKSPMPSVEDVVARMEKTLSTVDRESIYGVTLAEENSPYGGYGELLHNVYTELKKRYPSVRFFQWYSAGLPGWPEFSPVPGFGAPLLAADGWIVDDYYVRGENFKRMMWKYRMLDVPFSCTVWSSSGWGTYWSKQSAFDWADPQILLLKSMNMSASLFSVNQLRSGPQGDVLGDCFAWEMDDGLAVVEQEKISGLSYVPRLERYYFNGDLYGDKGTPRRIYPPTRKKFDKYVEWSRKAPSLARPPQPNDAEINFMGRKMPMKVQLDEQGNFKYYDEFESLITRKARYPMNGGRLMVRHADVSGAMDLVYDGYAEDAGFRIRGASGRDVEVTITYQFVSEKPFSDMVVKIRGGARAKLGGALSLSVSMNGNKWIKAKASRQTAPDGKWAGEIVVDSSVDKSLLTERYFQAYVRIVLANSANAQTDFSTFFNAIEVTARKPD